MNVLLLRWDTKPDKRIRGTFLRLASTRTTSFYAALRNGLVGEVVRDGNKIVSIG